MKTKRASFMSEGEQQHSDQNSQTEVSKFQRSFDQVSQVLLELEQPQTLPYAIDQAFYGTPLAEVFADFPEGDISPAQLRKRLSIHLNSAFQQVMVTVDEANRREHAMHSYPPEEYDFVFFDDFEEDEAITEEAFELAQPIRETIFQLVPATQDDTDGLRVEFTPVIKTEQQLILHEWRYRAMRVDPAATTHIYEVEQEQYRVFVRAESGNWQQQGVLPFYTISEYADKEDKGMSKLAGQLQRIEDERSRVVKEINAAYALEQAADEDEPEDDVDPDDEYEEQDSTEDEEEDEYQKQLSILHQQYQDIYRQIMLYDGPEPLRTRTFIPTTPFDSAIFNEGVILPDETQVYEALQCRDVFAALPEAFNFPLPSPPPLYDPEEKRRQNAIDRAEFFKRHNGSPPGN
jgi:hypothetical protein